MDPTSYLNNVTQLAFSLLALESKLAPGSTMNVAVAQPYRLMINLSGK
jgi:hypothetical protein